MTYKGTFTGKGSLRRPTNEGKFGDNFDRIFAKRGGRGSSKIPVEVKDAEFYNIEEWARKGTESGLKQANKIHNEALKHMVGSCPVALSDSLGNAYTQIREVGVNIDGEIYIKSIDAAKIAREMDKPAT